MARVLIFNPDPPARATLQVLLELEGHECGVADSADICPSTALPEKGQRVAGKYYAAADRRFVDGAGKVSGVTVADTGGCNAAQIAAKLKLSKQDSKGGITLATLTSWANTH